MNSPNRRGISWGPGKDARLSPGLVMIRLVVITLLVVLVWFWARQVIGWARSRSLDWSGIMFALGFVALAFYLRHVTGIG
ncbi:hypothetical protein MesoLjLc_44640 [Mesorhizobium sp. L-8-10]|uniref:hypothetical protein n=1 Tax=Mesorhizobium sp. L-8-10 TaxID=2744523 RepID=UPI001925F6BC|nr:hypothetical protein [Mesorhizobium sp. L-8-10]BCH32534.1 hypothetical protein MesoLjLc_44640 [Mesorhizobium sp. L-8-10]